MSVCELLEVEVSTLIDGEMEGRAVPGMVDHLLTCPSCREFYRLARGLEAEIAEASGCDVSDLPPGLWSRVESALDTARIVGASTPRLRLTAWALGLAAALVLLVGGWSLARLWPASGSSRPRVLEVQLAGDPGGMSDERFLELTVELLQADRRYHHKMQEIMTAVSVWDVAPEGSRERSWLTESGELSRASDHRPVWH